jgi:vacuolar-type H+-ATPase subunit C/Vma6
MTVSDTIDANAQTDPTAWSYISGRLSVLETQLLNRGFFEMLAKCRTLSDARSALAKTGYRQFFSSDESIKDYLDILDLYRKSVYDDILSNSPDQFIGSFFDMKERYISFRKMFLNACRRGASINELDGLFDILSPTLFEKPELSVYKSMLRNREAPQNSDAVGKSLYLDSVISSLEIIMSSLAPEKTVSDMLTDISVLKCWSSILRSKWNGTTADVIQKWFVLPGKYSSLPYDTALLSETNPLAPLNDRISETVLRRLRSLGNDVLKQNIDSAVNDAIRDDVFEFRKITYGPEKMLSFFIALDVELDNLRLSLASVSNGINPKTAIDRFRREYA